MEHYNLIVETTGKPDETGAEHLVDALTGYSPAASTSDRGRLQVTFTVPADDMPQAIKTGLALLQSNGIRIATLEVMTTAEFDERVGIEPLPELLSVAQAAEQLGISRQAALKRITTGALPAKKVGDLYVIPASAVR